MNTSNHRLDIFSPRVYKLAGYLCFACILAGVVMALYAVWFAPEDDELFWKAASTVAIIFFGSVLMMAIASVRARDTRHHESFRLTSEADDG
jgi:membrane protein YdbS with pleckstrin-like domain